jgi:hypothetical protein
MQTQFQIDLAKKRQIESQLEKASKTLNQFPKGGPLGLTPDNVKRSPQWQLAKASFEKLAKQARAFNQWFIKQYKVEYREHRRALR